MYTLRGHLVGDESILTFTRGCTDFRDPTTVCRLNEEPVTVRPGCNLEDVTDEGNVE